MFVSVVCCQVDVSATGRSLVKRSPTECSVSLRVIYKPRAQGGPGPRWAVETERNKKSIVVQHCPLTHLACAL